MSNHHKEKEDDQQEETILQKEPQPTVTAITYGQNSVSMKCPFCLQHIHSQIILKPQFISVVLGISIFVIVPQMVMIVCIILLLHATASRKHRCPLCQRQLGSDGKFLLFFKDQVYSLDIFSLGLIFTKKMLVTTCFIAFTFLIFSIRVSQINKQRLIKTTWAQYVSQCIQGDHKSCFSRYRYKQFMNWQGHLLRLKDNRQSLQKWYIHGLSLYMKMNPQSKVGSQFDILITLNSQAIYKYQNVLKQLQHGDLIRFNCTLHEKEQGSLKDALHFHVQALQKIGHDANYSLYTSQIEQQWIQVHIQNKGKLRSESDPNQQKKKL